MAVKLSISITQNSQNVANNTSNVTVALSVSWTYGSWNATTGPHGYLTIDGTKYTFEKKPFNSNHTTTGSQTIFTKTVNVSHNSDGTKNLACSGYYWVDLDSASSVTASAAKALTTIPRKSSLSASNGTLGTAQTLTVTKQASAFTHTITYKCGSATGTVCTKSSSTSISWTPPASLASQNTTGKSVSVTFTITTFSGSTNIGSNTKTITCSIPSTAAFSPKCSVSIAESTNYSATYGAPIKGLSKLNVTVTPTLAYGSAISSYSTAINGTKYTSASFTTGFLTSSGTITANATVKDKRGNSGTGSASITGVLDYDPPVVDRFTVHRCDADGTVNDKGDHVKITISYRVSSLNNKNKCTSYVQYKKASETNYSDPIYLGYPNTTYSVTDKEIIFAADTGSSYDVKLYITDNLKTTSVSTSVSTAFTIMHWKEDGTGMAVGKISERSGVFDVGMKTRLSGGMEYPILEPGTDIDTLITPGFYVGANISSYNYTGTLPASSGTFILEVMSAGDDGQICQRFTRCSKTEARRYERFWYKSGNSTTYDWGNPDNGQPGGWMQVSPTNISKQFTHTVSTADTFEYVGSVTIPKYRFYTITARGLFVNSRCTGIILGQKPYDSSYPDNFKFTFASQMNDDLLVHYPSCTYSNYTGSAELVLHIWGRWNGTTENKVDVTGFYMPY